MNIVYVRFDKNLDYKMVVNSSSAHYFCSNSFGDDVIDMISPTKFIFDRDKLGEYIQRQYDVSKEYVYEKRKLPSYIIKDYWKNQNNEDNGIIWSQPLYFNDFEPDILLDDHLVTVNDKNDKVLGFFASEDDFEKIVNELNLLNISDKMDVGDQESFDRFCEYANEHIEEFL